MDDNPWIVLVLVIVLLECISAGKFIVKLWTTGIPTLRRAIAHRLGKKPCSSVEDPEIKDEERKLLQIRRVSWAKSTVVALWAFSCVMCLSVIGKAFHRKVIVREEVIFRGSMLLMMTAAGVFREKLLTHRTLPALHVACMVYLSAQSINNNLPIAPVLDETMVVLAVAMSGLCLRSSLCAATNGAHLVVGIIRVVFLTEHESVSDMVGACAKNVAYSAGAIAVIAAVESAAEGAVRREIKDRSEQCQQSAVMSLLERTCDAVVAMDQDLRLKAHVPKLAGLLMHSAGRSLKGYTLASLFAEAEDRDRFEEGVRQSRAGTGDGVPSAGMLTVRMRDAMGNVFGVVLVHIPYTSVGGRLHHLVGIREDSDEAVPLRGDVHRRPDAVLRPDIARAVLGLEASPAPDADAAAAPLPAPSSLAGSLRSPVGWQRSQSSGSSSASGVSLGPRQPDADLVCNVLFEPGLPILHATPGICEDLHMADEGVRHLSDFIAGGDLEIRKWMANVLNEAMNEENEWNFTNYYGTVEFKRASAAGPTVPVKRRVWVHFPEPLDDGRIPLVIGLCRRRGACPAADPHRLSPNASPPPPAAPPPLTPTMAL